MTGPTTGPEPDTAAARSAPLPGGLYLVATPIGTARDITLRALDILASADVLAAEDTRSLRRLMEIHGLPLGGRRIVAYHDHNGPKVRPRLMAEIAAGRAVVYASEAGTPLVSDPGYQLVRDAISGGHPVTGAPGPSAALAALVLSGLPSDRFLFAGFLPTGGGARARAIDELGRVPATLILFEAPGRAAATLRALAEALGPRPAALCRELTKRFEEVRRGPLDVLAEGAQAEPPRGEVAIVVDRGAEEVGDIDAALGDALAGMSVRDAADMVAGATGAKRRDVYRRALELSRSSTKD